MTREQKLALIVGFSLVLLVGVLISDHLSGARRAKIAKVEPDTPAPMTAAAIAPPGPATDVHVAPPAAADDPIHLILGSGSPALPPQAPPASSTTLATGPSPEAPAPQPASPSPDLTSAALTALGGEVLKSGGTLVRGADGAWDIHLPKDVVPGLPPSGPQKPATSETRIEPLKTHIVKSGETLFEITSKYYGNGNLWNHLAKFNGMDRTGTIRIGTGIKIPSKDVLLGRAVASTPTQPQLKVIKPAPQERKPATPRIPDRTKPRIELASYTVRKGDTLVEISQKTLGSARRWQEIAELNRLDDEDSIVAGTVLKIPAKRS